MNNIKRLKERLLLRWDMRRVLYAGIGGWIMIQSILVHQWWLTAAGAYFFFMGLFAFGCAGGSCTRKRPGEVE